MFSEIMSVLLKQITPCLYCIYNIHTIYEKKHMNTDDYAKASDRIIMTQTKQLMNHVNRACHKTCNGGPSAIKDNKTS